MRKGRAKIWAMGLGCQQGLEAKEEAEAIAVRGCSKQSLFLPHRQSEAARHHPGEDPEGEIWPFLWGPFGGLGPILSELPSLGRHCVSERQLSTL